MTVNAPRARELTIPDGDAAQEMAVLRLDGLTAEVGWLLVGAGVIGVIIPGVPGAPFLIVGAMVVTPGGKRLLSRWAGKKPPRIVAAGMRQIGRFVDDLERRYPRARS